MSGYPTRSILPGLSYPGYLTLLSYCPTVSGYLTRAILPEPSYPGYLTLLSAYCPTAPGYLTRAILPCPVISASLPYHSTVSGCLPFSPVLLGYPNPTFPWSSQATELPRDEHVQITRADSLACRPLYLTKPLPIPLSTCCLKGFDLNCYVPSGLFPNPMHKPAMSARIRSQLD